MRRVILFWCIKTKYNLYIQSIKGEKTSLPSTAEGREDIDDDDPNLQSFQVGRYQLSYDN